MPELCGLQLSHHSPLAEGDPKATSCWLPWHSTGKPWNVNITKGVDLSRPAFVGRDGWVDKLIRLGDYDSLPPPTLTRRHKRQKHMEVSVGEPGPHLSKICGTVKVFFGIRGGRIEPLGMVFGPWHALG